MVTIYINNKKIERKDLSKVQIELICLKKQTKLTKCK